MSEIIFYCKDISKQQIKDAISKGAKTLGAIQQLTTACTCNNCAVLNPSEKCCSEEINIMLNEKNSRNLVLSQP